VVGACAFQRTSRLTVHQSGRERARYHIECTIYTSAVTRRPLEGGLPVVNTVPGRYKLSRECPEVMSIRVSTARSTVDHIYRAARHYTIDGSQHHVRGCHAIPRCIIEIVNSQVDCDPFSTLSTPLCSVPADQVYKITLDPKRAGCLNAGGMSHVVIVERIIPPVVLQVLREVSRFCAVRGLRCLFCGSCRTGKHHSCESSRRDY
jgi:hypothetical protein